MAVCARTRSHFDSTFNLLDPLHSVDESVSLESGAEEHLALLFRGERLMADGGAEDRAVTANSA